MHINTAQVKPDEINKNWTISVATDESNGKTQTGILNCNNILQSPSKGNF